MHKPGQTILPPTEAAAFVAALPARVIPGVGSKVDKMLSHHLIEYIRDLRQFSHAQLEPIIGGNTALASYLSEACWGKDETPVREKGLPSKVSVEDSFKVCDSIEAARCIIRKLAPDLIARLKEDVWEENRKTRTLRLSWSDANNESSTRRHAASTNLPQEVHCNSNVQSAADSVIQKAVSLLQRNLPTSGSNLKLLNIAAVNISPKEGTRAIMLINPWTGKHGLALPFTERVGGPDTVIYLCLTSVLAGWPTASASCRGGRLAQRCCCPEPARRPYARAARCAPAQTLSKGFTRPSASVALQAQAAPFGPPCQTRDQSVAGTPFRV